MSFLTPKTPKPMPSFSPTLGGTAIEDAGSQRRHAIRMRIGHRASTLLTGSSLAKPIGEGAETREGGRQTARTREGRRASTILTDSSLAKPIGEGTETREGERPAATQQPQPKKKEGPETREEERQKKLDPCQVIIDARKREFKELLRVRRAIGPAKNAIDAKIGEINQLNRVRPSDRLPGEQAPPKKKTEPLPLPIPELPRKGKRPFPPTTIIDLFLELQRKAMEGDEFNRRRAISAEKLKAELKELEKELENLIHQERNLEANVDLLSERNRKCRAGNG